MALICLTTRARSPPEDLRQFLRLSLGFTRRRHRRAELWCLTLAAGGAASPA